MVTGIIACFILPKFNISGFLFVQKHFPSASPESKTHLLFSMSLPQISRFKTEKGILKLPFSILSICEIGIFFPLKIPFKSVKTILIFWISELLLKNSLNVIIFYNFKLLFLSAIIHIQS